MISLFTPTHDARYLGAAHDSLLAQAGAPAWEWVIVPNGNAVEIPAAVRDDPRVRIVPAPAGLEREGVGALKRYACQHCRGGILFELDHDDLLAPTALAEVRDAVDRDGAGFVYSDFCEFRADGSSRTYLANHGWQQYEVEFQGRTWQAMRAFPADPRSLHLIFYAPNHLRAWTRAAYDAAGGHDASLPVTDDHDLLCRTYLAGVKFVHLPRCLYFYRLLEEGANTFLQRNAEIQQRQQQISNTYVYRLIAEWCRREGLPMYDLGGGHNSPAGYRSVDLANADVTCDVRRGLPFAESSVGCIRAWDFLEHIPHCRDSSCSHGTDGAPLCTVGLMNEIHRVLVPGGWLVSRTPSTDGRGAFQDPTHASFWNPNSFWYYTRREQAQFVPGIRCRFQGTRIWQTFPTEWHQTHNIPYVYADLVALKGQRQPGNCEI